MNNEISYFIIGGSGFLGSAFSTYLINKGYAVNIISRGQISDSKTLSFKEEYLDRLIISSIKNIIVDFAYTSVPNTSFSDPIKDFSENLYNINCHLAFASHLPNSSYIYISSGGTVYGNVKETIPINENISNFPLSPYGITKLASERYAIMHREIYGLDVKIVRPSNIFGPGQKPGRGQGFIPTAIEKTINNETIEIFGDGNIIRDYLYIDDFCEALYIVIAEGITGEIYNLGVGYGLTINNILNYIDDLKLRQLNVAYFSGRPYDVRYNVLNSNKLRSLGWQPKVSIQEALHATAKWIMDNFSK